MSEPDLEALAKEIDDIDTNYAVNERLTSDERERLWDIAYGLKPHLGDPDALRVALDATKLLEKAGEVLDVPEGVDFDTTVCRICGQEYSGTEAEIKDWEGKHIAENHEEYLNRPY